MCARLTRAKSGPKRQGEKFVPEPLPTGGGGRGRPLARRLRSAESNSICFTSSFMWCSASISR